MAGEAVPERGNAIDPRNAVGAATSTFQLIPAWRITDQELRAAAEARTHNEKGEVAWRVDVD